MFYVIQYIYFMSVLSESQASYPERSYIIFLDSSV